MARPSLRSADTAHTRIIGSFRVKDRGGETPEEALIREIQEELATTFCIERFLTTVEYDYPEFHLSMDCFLCSLVGETPRFGNMDPRDG
jgi:ADP-ribose pyrophosphatase YjhB (NUDIX family)